MQSLFNTLTFVKVKNSQSSRLAAILNVYFWHFPPKFAKDIGDCFLRIVSKEAKTTEKFHAKKMVTVPPDGNLLIVEEAFSIIVQCTLITIIRNYILNTSYFA